MGFYDCRCMVTGVSLHGIDASVVVLRRAGDAYQPITLGIAGTYDRYGSIDGITEDTNTDLVLTYFRDRLRDGRFVVDTDYLKIEAESPFTDIEELLWCFERNSLCFGDAAWAPDPVATLDGAQVFFALIAQPVWDALAATVIPTQRSAHVWFERLFGESPTAGEIYRGRLAEVSEPVRQLYVISEFLATRGLVWAPPAEPSQRYPTEYGAQYELGEFLDEARRDYGEVAAVCAALDEYEQLVGRWIED